MENLDPTIQYSHYTWNIRWLYERLDPFLPSRKIGKRQIKYRSGWSIAVQFLNGKNLHSKIWSTFESDSTVHTKHADTHQFVFPTVSVFAGNFWNAMVELYVRWHKLWKEWHRRKVKREICRVFYLLPSLSCGIFILHLMKQNNNWSVFIFHLSKNFPFPLRPMVSMASMASYPLVRMMRTRIVWHFLRSLCEQKLFRSASVRCPLINNRSESSYFRKKGNEKLTLYLRWRNCPSDTYFTFSAVYLNLGCSHKSNSKRTRWTSGCCVLNAEGGQVKAN